MLTQAQVIRIKQLAYNCVQTTGDFLASNPIEREGMLEKVKEAKQQFDDYMDDLVE